MQIKLNSKTFTGLALLIVALALGYFIFSGQAGNAVADVTSKFSGTEKLTDDVGEIELIKIHDGLSNVTTTEDSLNDAETEMTFLSADANIDDGEEYAFNITFDREKVANAGKVYLECSAPDKEIDGVTAKNLIEKTAGDIDLVFVGADSSGTSKGTKVTTTHTFSAGEGSASIQVTADHEETYHDGMTDIQDNFQITCKVSPNKDMSNAKSVTAVIKANS
jgi:hypothetical protein